MLYTYKPSHTHFVGASSTTTSFIGLTSETLSLLPVLDDAEKLFIYQISQSGLPPIHLPLLGRVWACSSLLVRIVNRAP